MKLFHAGPIAHTPHYNRTIILGLLLTGLSFRLHAEIIIEGPSITISNMPVPDQNPWCDLTLKQAAELTTKVLEHPDVHSELEKMIETMKQTIADAASTASVELEASNGEISAAMQQLYNNFYGDLARVGQHLNRALEGFAQAVEKAQAGVQASLKNSQTHVEQVAQRVADKLQVTLAQPAGSGLALATRDALEKVLPEVIKDKDQRKLLQENMHRLAADDPSSPLHKIRQVLVTRSGILAERAREPFKKVLEHISDRIMRLVNQAADTAKSLISHMQGDLTVVTASIPQGNATHPAPHTSEPTTTPPAHATEPVPVETTNA